MEVEYQEEYIRNSRGVQLLTCRWLPFSSPKGLVFLCHGYGMECSEFMKGCGSRLASYGYMVIGIDYEGHGRSMGARCYIKKFNNIVNDCTHFFKSVSAQEEYKERRTNFCGGGGGVVVSSQISEKVKPHPVVINILTRVENIIPRWKIVPTKDVIDSAFKDPVKREQIRSNKLIYQDKPRLKTALEMLRTSMNLEDRLREVTVPFFVLHGEADAVTDPEVSRALYERASSRDKTIKLYGGMWHGLTSGEPDDNIEIVFSDIIAWLDKRSGDDHSIVAIDAMQPVNHSEPATMVKFTNITSPAMIERQKPRRTRTRSYANYLCGLKGRRMHHHSAV
ncbi:hypothetical protein F0562_000841 [Nyssa sinensis]|uniref:Serine aminopeptidase S33 domain-containing protein n=1 Tax=Nyssa sinensis TaxID=561372 RepID=A0A5J5C5L5_9ASTE|nr:hypothetical protein F0562_000841 [Nyssa sinensis]